MTKNLMPGINALAYMGVNAASPPNVTLHDRPPTQGDWKGYIIGDIWQVENSNLPSGDEYQIWTLVSLSQTQFENRALWLRITTTAGGGFDLFIITDPPTGTAIPTILGEFVLTTTQNLEARAGDAPHEFLYNLKDDVVINNSLTVTPLGGSVTQFVTVDTDGKFTTTAPDQDGQVPIGKGSDGSFLWKTIDEGSNITIVNGPNTITISSSAGGGGIDTVHNDSVTDVVMDAVDTSITIIGGNLIDSIADSSDPSNHTLLIGMEDPLVDGYVPISGSVGNPPVWAPITGTGGITITPGTNTIQVSGAGVGAQFQAVGDDGTTATPDGMGDIGIVGGTGPSGWAAINIHTYGDNLNTFSVGLKDSISWPATNIIGTGNDTGLIQLDGTRFMHAYGTDNTFLGLASGARNVVFPGSKNTGLGRRSLSNIESGGLNTAAGYDSLRNLQYGTHNTAVGANALLNLTGHSTETWGNFNTAVGAGALSSLVIGTGTSAGTTASYNTALGRQALNNLIRGSYCIGIGVQAGTNYSGSGEHSNIVIGNAGTLGDTGKILIGTHGDPLVDTGLQNRTHVAGIQPVPALANSFNVVFINTDHRLLTNPATNQNQILFSTATSASGGGTAWGNLSSEDFNVTPPGSGFTINNRREGFFVYGGGNQNAVTGNNQFFWLGQGTTGGSSITDFNTTRFNSGNWTHPSGSYGRYTAPYTGMYYMQCTIYASNVPPPPAPIPPPPPVVDCPIYIDVQGSGSTANRYQSIDPSFGTTQGTESRNFSAFIKLTVNDTVRFGFRIDDGTGMTNIYTVNTTALAANAGIQWCSGHLVFRL